MDMCCNLQDQNRKQWRFALNNWTTSMFLQAAIDYWKKSDIFSVSEMTVKRESVVYEKLGRYTC